MNSISSIWNRKENVTVHTKNITITKKGFEDFLALFKKLKENNPDHYQIINFCSVALKYDVWHIDEKAQNEIDSYVLKSMGIIIWLFKHENTILNFEKMNCFDFPTLQHYKDVLDLIDVIAEQRNLTITYRRD